MITLRGWQPSNPRENELVEVSIDPTTESPVTLDELKAHLRVTHTDDDDYLSSLLISCTASLEKFLGVSIVEHEITIQYKNGYGEFPLPYGPVQSIDLVKDFEDNTLVLNDEYTVSGTIYPRLTTYSYDRLTITYTTGFEDVPYDLKNEIMKMMAWNYEHRGDSAGDYQFTNAARAYRRVPKIM